MMMRAGRGGHAGPGEDLFATVGRRFRPDQMLGGEGAFIVQHAVDSQTKAGVVIKRPKDRLSARQMASLSVEAVALSRLNHPGIPKLIGCALDGDDPYLAMEFIRGARYNLNNIMDQRVACVVRLTISACYVLSEAHRQGIIHRDICPANMVMSNSRNMLSVIDFGVAYVPGQPDLASDRVVGRPDFIPPELTAPGGKADARSDIYSLGVMAYTYLSGHYPFQLGAVNDEAILTAHRTMDPVPISSLASWVPNRLARTVMRSIAREPERRFDDLAEFANALSGCIGL